MHPVRLAEVKGGGGQATYLVRHSDAACPKMVRCKVGKNTQGNGQCPDCFASIRSSQEEKANVLVN